MTNDELQTLSYSVPTALRSWIELYSGGEPIEAVVIGEPVWGGPLQGPGIPADMPLNRLLTWDEALPFLAYTFNDGFGAPGCHSIAAWTASWIISVSTYDGATSPFRIPRNPIAHEPIMPGG